MEFGILLPQGFATLQARSPDILEDGDSKLADLYRPTLRLLFERNRSFRDVLPVHCLVSVEVEAGAMRLAQDQDAGREVVAGTVSGRLGERG